MKNFPIFPALKVGLAALAFAGAALPASAATDSATQTLNLSIADIALLAVDGGSISLDITAPESAGDDPADASDDTTRLRYTSVVTSGETRKIQANISSGTVPSGTALKLTASPAGSNRGTGSGTVTLSTTNQDIIGSITSTATGSGANRAEIQYDLEVTDSESLEVTSPTLEITFTLTASS